MLKILLLPYLIFECICTIVFIINVGFLWYLLEAFFSLMLGSYLVIHGGGFGLYSNMQKANFAGIFGSFGFVFSGFLLILPGILCDILAVLIIIFSVFLTKKNTPSYTNDFSADDEIIDVEIIDERPNNLK